MEPFHHDRRASYDHCLGQTRKSFNNYAVFRLTCECIEVASLLPYGAVTSLLAARERARVHLAYTKVRTRFLRLAFARGVVVLQMADQVFGERGWGVS